MGFRAGGFAARRKRSHSPTRRPLRGNPRCFDSPTLPRSHRRWARANQLVDGPPPTLPRNARTRTRPKPNRGSRYSIPCQWSRRGDVSSRHARRVHAGGLHRASTRYVRVQTIDRGRVWTHVARRGSSRLGNLRAPCRRHTNNFRGSLPKAFRQIRNGPVPRAGSHRLRWMPGEGRRKFLPTARAEGRAASSNDPVGCALENQTMPDSAPRWRCQHQCHGSYAMRCGLSRG